ncbi:MAG: putative negative regulator of RcsB-dependent stress response [Pseudohongiellaceae bacterium]
MSDYSTEEEQIAAIKNWWKKNGTSLLIGIGLALLIVFGWKAYQNSVVETKTEASLLYQQMISAVTSTDLNEPEEGATVSYLAKELKSKFSDSEYAIYAALFIAKESVADENYDEAIQEFNWILANTEDQRIVHIVNGRLARIHSIQGDNEGALALLVATDPAFEASYQEIIGDIKVRSSEKQAAIDAYTKAYQLVKSNPQALPLLTVKLSNLGVDPETL